MANKRPLVQYDGVISEILATDSLIGATPSTSNSGTAVLDFGTVPGTNVVTATVTGQTSIALGSSIEAFIMAEATAEHNAYEHSVVPIKVSCGNIVAGTGFDIIAVTEYRLTGTFNVRWIWV